MATGAVPEGLLAHLNNLTGIGRSDDGLVRVEIDGSGTPTQVTIEPAAMNNGPRTLGEAFTQAMKAALDDLHAQTVALVRDTTDTLDGAADPGRPDDAVRKVNRHADEVMADFDVVRRRLLDNLPGT